MAATEFEFHQRGIERLLELVHERGLTVLDGDRIRFAVEKRHGEWERMLGGRAGANLGGRFVAAMLAADRELSPEQVGELEALIVKGLPSPD